MNLNDLHKQFEVGITDDGYICLGVNDRNGKEYMDGSIVRVNHSTDRFMIGVIRYSFGRFEIVCTFKDQRFIFGLNHDHEIIGHIADKDNSKSVLESQASQTYATNR